MRSQPGFLKRGEPVRLQTFLARSGLASRRAAEEMIAHGRVEVNGETVTAMGLTVIPGVDRVEVDGEEVKVAPTTWLALHKPKGYVTSRMDQYGRRTVYDLLPEKYHGLFHVGRLDRDSEGLLLLTNDGELANRFLHPSFGVTKEYDVIATGKPSDATLRRLVEGVELEDGIARAEEAKLIGPAGPGQSRLKIVLREGKKREVRRMLAALGHEVVGLVRRRFGPVELGELPKGKYRVVAPEELSHVRKPPRREKARDAHNAYAGKAAKPRGKTAGRGKPGTPRTRSAAPGGEDRPRGRAAADEKQRPAAHSGAKAGPRRFAGGGSAPKRAPGPPQRSAQEGGAKARRSGQAQRGRPPEHEARGRAARERGEPEERGRGPREWGDEEEPRPAPRGRPADRAGGRAGGAARGGKPAGAGRAAGGGRPGAKNDGAGTRAGGARGGGKGGGGGRAGGGRGGSGPAGAGDGRAGGGRAGGGRARGGRAGGGRGGGGGKPRGPGRGGGGGRRG